MQPVAIVGAGPAGLAAAEVVAAKGLPVVVFEAMPSPARKFLMAGLGGLNLTHSEPMHDFAGRYGEAENHLKPMLDAFPPEALRQWAEDLGEPTFIGTSGRVFPTSFKTSPLLRKWFGRLNEAGVELRTGHKWTGWNDDGALTFVDQDPFEASATVLAMGGASWPRLGSTGSWAKVLAKKGVPLADFGPSNCGFEVPWSDRLRQGYAGQALKNTTFRFGNWSSTAEAVVTERGIEGGAIYALSSVIRQALAGGDDAQILYLDLIPHLSMEQATLKLAKTKNKDSLGNRLRKALGLSNVQRGLFFEAFGPGFDGNIPMALKALPIPLEAPFDIARAISSSGGVKWEAVESNLAIKGLDQVYAAGEMLDWEAPTGGYLLQGCFATGRWAGRAVVEALED